VMITGMRVYATALILGLPTALLAHALVFGSEHAAGGAWSSAAIAIGCVGLMLVVALHSRSAVQGSIAASRLRAMLPPTTALAVSASAWFVLLELCEPAHNVLGVALVIAVVTASVLMRLSISAVASLFAAVAIALGCSEKRIWHLADSGARLPHSSPHLPDTLTHACKLFSRPPPVLS
jgi:hypothetical protein